ncbi:MAG: RagB/SusD family nutrient uptake outer membrane protein [Odoribacter sp.]
MKTSNLLILLFLFSLTSCNQWLDVRPEDQIGEKDLFSTGEGYRNALNGIYKSLSDYSLYGRQLSWGIPEAMAQTYNYSWGNSKVVDLKLASDYNWTQTQLEPLIDRSWSMAYTVVANCNNLIQNIRKADSELFYFKDPEKRVILGEALALRAYLQFDLLRLFAAAPITQSKKKYISYITTYPAYISPAKPVDECIDSIISDLTNARQLVWSFDSIRGNLTPKGWFEEKANGVERFASVRGYRLNYFAIQAVLARVLLYAGKSEDALAMASQLISYHQQVNAFGFADNASQGNLKMSDNVLFGLYAPKLPEWERLVNDFSNATSSVYPNTLLINKLQEIFAPDLVDEEDGYGNITTTSKDYRYANSVDDFEQQGRFYVLKKYREQTMNTPQAEVGNTLIPMIRMTEMYYIAAEVIAKKGSINSATDLLCAVKFGRGISDESTLTNLKININNDETKFMTELFRDARREFLAEGQMFYMYKRLNLPIPALKPIQPSEDLFVIPVPKSESIK